MCAAERELLADEVTLALRKIVAAAKGYQKEAAAAQANLARAGVLPGDDELAAARADADVLRAGKEAAPAPPEAQKGAPGSGAAKSGEQPPLATALSPREISLEVTRGGGGAAAAAQPAWLARVLRARRLWLGALLLLLVDLWAVVGMAAVMAWGW